MTSYKIVFVERQSAFDNSCQAQVQVQVHSTECLWVPFAERRHHLETKRIHIPPLGQVVVLQVLMLSQGISLFLVRVNPCMSREPGLSPSLSPSIVYCSRLHT